MKTYLCSALSLLAIPQSSLVATDKKDGKEQPNILLIVTDDVGFGDISCNGATEIATPHIDALAQGGVRFVDAHAVAATSTPSRYSLLTGRYSWRRNDTGIADGDAGSVIHTDEYTMPQMFRNAGYRTGAVGKWHLGLGEKNGTQDWNKELIPGPRAIGFDYSYIMAATADRVPCVWIQDGHVVALDPTDPIEVSYSTPFEGEPLGRTHLQLLTKLYPSPNHGHDQAIVNGISRIGYMRGGKSALWQDENIADTIAEKAVDFIRQADNRPFFLYLGTNDVHVPRYPHPRFQGKSGMGYRGDAILQLDSTVGRVMAALRERGLLENTIVIFTSDNGPVVDDGYADKAVALLGDHRPWGDMRGGKYSIFEAGTRIPLIVQWQGRVPAGRVSKSLVSQIDLFASMATLIGAKIPDSQAPDSQAWLSAWMGDTTATRPYIIEAAGALSVYDGEWKYIAPSKGAAYNKLVNIELGNSPIPQLYHIATDKAEQHNLYDSRPNIAKRLQAILLQEQTR